MMTTPTGRDASTIMTTKLSMTMDMIISMIMNMTTSTNKKATRTEGTGMDIMDTAMKT